MDIIGSVYDNEDNVVLRLDTEKNYNSKATTELRNQTSPRTKFFFNSDNLNIAYTNFEAQFRKNKTLQESFVVENTYAELTLKKDRDYIATKSKIQSFIESKYL